MEVLGVTIPLLRVDAPWQSNLLISTLVATLACLFLLLIFNSIELIITLPHYPPARGLAAIGPLWRAQAVWRPAPGRWQGDHGPAGTRAAPRFPRATLNGCSSARFRQTAIPYH
jgi:hypothetical protein